MKTTSLIVAVCTALLTGARVNAADAEKGFALKAFAEGFVSPSALVPLPGSNGRLLVADQAGTIHVVSGEGKVADALFLDLRPRLTKLNEGFDERGLLGLVLHPKFTENKKFYVVYSAPKRASAPEDWDHTMNLSVFTANADGLSAKPDSERILLQIDQPLFNHNAGSIAFGREGYLYIASGDGGGANDQGKRPSEGNGQNLQTFLGKILRIDVNSGNPYSVPQDNPFVGKENVLPEIWAYGLRNPWRISFDRGGTGELFAADVGQDAFEEVNIIVKGGNYGWNIREGFHCFDPKNPTKAPEDCPDRGANGDPLLDPILEYKNVKAHRNAPDAQGASVTGGYVYRGKALPAWQGKYIFGDWSKYMFKAEGVLFAASRSSNGKWTLERIIPASHPDGLNLYVTAFGEDADGELYVLTNATSVLAGKTGKVFKLVPM